jgi:hypothetical protein
MHLRLSELVQVFHEVENMCAGTSGEWQRRSMVAQVLAKGVPISSLLRFVAARRSHRSMILRLQLIMTESYTTTTVNRLPSHIRSSCPIVDQ